MKDGIVIRLNGKGCSVEPGTTIAQIVHEHANDPASVAVAVNGTMIRRDAYASARVQQDDDVRLIRAIAGG